ncbi:MAG: hypothetical protein WC797_02665 [Candidatus Paceibacterota bacterium]|jgi:hypothetical protein
MLKKPYIKKYIKINDITVYIVDGPHIRKHIDKEFTNFGHHLRFEFIPLKEFWLDRQATPGEEHYFIKNMLTQYKLMTTGTDYDKAVDLAGIAEQKMRDSDPTVIELKKLIPDNKKALLDKIKVRLLKAYSNDKMFTYVVDGSIVRSLFYINFVQGGHSLAYPEFVPNNEIWVDDDITPYERKYILLHEIHERAQMAHGWNYIQSHTSANKLEYEARWSNRGTMAKIKHELDRCTTAPTSMALVENRAI